MNCAIIGAGQLGSRHLQGLLKSTKSFDTYVIDPSIKSLELAQQRASEIETSNRVYYCSEINDLPMDLEFVVVATNSNVRLEVIKKLIKHSSISFLLLEKVLFQRKKDYQIARDLFSHTSTRVYVNHPRRIQKFYQEIKMILSNYPKDIFEIEVYGVNWGLGCNGLHFTDLFEFLFEDRILDYNSELLDNKIIDSKRSGFKEFTGILSGMTVKGHNFQIKSIQSENGEISPISLCLSSPSLRLFISEAFGQPFYHIETYAPRLSRIAHSEDYFLPQSSLTGEIFESCIGNKKILLPSFEFSLENHLKFIASILRHYNITEKLNEETCPIT